MMRETAYRIDVIRDPKCVVRKQPLSALSVVPSRKP